MARTLCYSIVGLLCGVAGASLGADVAKPPAGATDKPRPTSEAAKPPRISSNVVVEPGATLTDKESRELSFAAGRVLKHVAQARSALKEHKMDQAISHVDQGLKLMAIIDGALPRYKVKTTITAGELVYCDEDEISPEFITIFDELEHRDILSPVVRAKANSAHAQAAADAAQKSSPQPAGAEAPSAKDSIYVSGTDIDYTSVKLDVDLAGRMLRMAKEALRTSDPQQADEALAELQTGAVLLEYDEIDLPLEQAADNLKLAEAEMNGGRYKAAQAALNAAIDELEKYEKTSGETRGKEVTALHKEIREMTAQLDKGQPSHSDAQRHASRISGWWDRATKWFRKK